jgi:hypothetical protein
MSQTINVSITGSFPSYQIAFSAEPNSVPYGQSATITYAMASKGFKIQASTCSAIPSARTTS